MLVRMVYYASDELMYWDTTTVIFHFFGFVMGSFLVAVGLYVLVEAPAAHLLEALVKKLSGGGAAGVNNKGSVQKK